jgi:hypothetical protein
VGNGREVNEKVVIVIDCGYWGVVGRAERSCQRGQIFSSEVPELNSLR